MPLASGGTPWTCSGRQTYRKAAGASLTFKRHPKMQGMAYIQQLFLLIQNNLAVFHLYCLLLLSNCLGLGASFKMQ
jgi:hypothetical protein